jgi:transposase-like protein
MGRQRRRFSADFKTRVALEAIHEHQTVNELASEYGVHPNLIREWKKHLLSELPQRRSLIAAKATNSGTSKKNGIASSSRLASSNMSWPGWKKSGRGPLSNSVWPSR